MTSSSANLSIDTADSETESLSASNSSTLYDMARRLVYRECEGDDLVPQAGHAEVKEDRFRQATRRGMKVMRIF
jgi:hypothetical protein